jgi:hypothetical protein
MKLYELLDITIQDQIIILFNKGFRLETFINNEKDKLTVNYLDCEVIEQEPNEEGLIIYLKL